MTAASYPTRQRQLVGKRLAGRPPSGQGGLVEVQVTGLPFDRSGPVVVPGALVPVLADLTHDYAVYVEPNVWVRHDLRARR